MSKKYKIKPDDGHFLKDAGKPETLDDNMITLLQAGSPYTP